MRISELAAASDVPVATVKYYLREGLLHPGEQTSATSATYDASHLRRLRLIRALVDVGGLTLGAVRAVLDALDAEGRDLHDKIGQAHTMLSLGPAPSETSRRRVDGLLRRLRWRVHSESPHRDALARALQALDDLDQSLPEDKLDVYADAAHRVAAADIAGVPAHTPADALRHAVIGTVLAEPVLLALRRLAHEDQSSRRFGKRPRRRAP